MCYLLSNIVKAKQSDYWVNKAYFVCSNIVLSWAPRHVMKCQTHWQCIGSSRDLATHCSSGCVRWYRWQWGKYISGYNTESPTPQTEPQPCSGEPGNRFAPWRLVTSDKYSCPPVQQHTPAQQIHNACYHPPEKTLTPLSPCQELLMVFSKLHTTLYIFKSYCSKKEWLPR